MNPTLEALALLTQVLTHANVAIPVVVGLITGIAATVRGMTGEGPSVAEIADMLEQQVAANATYGAAEVVRLKQLLGRDE